MKSLDKENIEIKVAKATDLEGILKLQFDNQKSQGGALSGELSLGQLKEMMQDMPQIVAIVNGQIVGFLLTTSAAVHKKRSVPILDAMLAAYAGHSDSYIYGPVCVSTAQRGKGLAQLMFKELLDQEPDREGILFIRNDNEASLRAHEKMGIHQVSSFNFNEAEFNVFAYRFT